MLLIQLCIFRYLFPVEHASNSAMYFPSSFFQ